MQDFQTVAVVGLGYVGLPLALLADRKGYKVIGLEINKEKVEALKNARSYVDDISADELRHSAIDFTDDFAKIKSAQVVIICVPTPVNPDKTPDLGPVVGAVTNIAPYLQPRTLVILESTVNPGVCDEIVTPLLEELAEKKVGKDLYLAHCPERINPGDPKWNVSNINRVVGANTDKELTLAKDFYESLIDADIRAMGSLKEAEAVKVVENSFRDINIAFVNELAMSFHKMNIDVVNVINGAATKPFAFMPHFPGCGVGGHCIPVDPYYLMEYAHGFGFEHEFLRLARNINENMPAYTVDLLEEALNDKKLSLNGAKVALLGISYKENVGDDRESPAHQIRALLEERGADLVVYDPYISKKSTVSSLDKALEHASAVVVATGHQDFRSLRAKALKAADISVVIDGRNVLKDLKQELKAANITYKGIGV
jgi:UDP-N-acetyl-D-glucosamine dehydrogenase